MNLKESSAYIAVALLFFSILFSCASSQTVFAHSGDVFTAEATVTPTIDGVISPGEWDDADSLRVPLEYLALSPNTTVHEATLYVKNDEAYLYLAAVVEGDDNDPNFPDFGVWWFDNDHDGVIEVGDDGLVIRSDGNSTDIYRPNTIEGFISFERRLESDEYDGGTDDIVGAVTHTNPGGVGDYTFEYRHPLDTADNAHDFSLELGDTVGFQFQYVNGSEGRGNEIAHSLVQTDDGGYAMAGYAGSFGTLKPSIAQYGDFFLVKTDSERNPEWGRTYGGEGGLEVALSMVQTDDEGYAMAGYTNSSGAGGYDLWMVKTDPSGNAEWSRTYGGGELDAAWSLVQTGDGGYALAGVTGSYGAGSGDFWLIKTDPSGDMEWSRTYGGGNDDAPSTVVQTGDGGYALAGYTWSFGATRRDFWLVKTDPEGNPQWNMTYGDLYEVGSTETAYSLVQTGDGGYALAGYTESLDASDRDFVLIKTDSNGDMEFSRTYGGGDLEIAYSLVQTDDEGYALAGYTNSFGLGDYDFWLVKTDSSGNVEWNQTYSDSYVVGNNEIAYSLVQTGDGGYALAGIAQWLSAVSYDFWLVKTDSVGATQWDWTYARAARAQWPGFPNYGDIVVAEPPPTQYTLTVEVVGSGTTNPAPGSYMYDEGSVVNVDALPEVGWVLDYWLLDGVNVGSADPYTVTINTNHVLSAVFVGVPPPEEPPVASFTFSPESPVVNEPVSFDAGSSHDPDGTITSYVWDFGDEATDTGETTTHTYKAAGTYTVTLTVTDNDDQTGAHKEDITVIGIDVTNPVADGGEDEAVEVGTTVIFNAGGSRDDVGIDKYEWNFGDGTTGTGMVVSHVYMEPGIYVVTLIVEDAAGNRGTDSIIVTVEGDKAVEVGREPRSVYIVAEVAVAGAAVTAVTAALASFSGLGQTFNSAVSRLTIPEWLKDFLQLYGEKIFETIDKVKLEALGKVPFITKGELSFLGISALIMTVVFGFVEANGLPRFLNPSVLAAVIPSTLFSVCVVSIAEQVSEAFCARTCKVYRQFRFWMYGLGLLLISGLLFLFPSGSPGITRYQSGQISNKTKGLIVLSKMLILLTLTIPFAGFFMLGFKIIGDAGLLLTLMTVFYSLVPLKPLSGKAVFDYRKEVSLIALVLTGILFYGCTVNLLPHVIYLAVGVVSAFLAAITINQLRKSSS